MRAWVGITDFEWYQLLAGLSHLDDVNFWQPGGSREFRVLSRGELFLFKLHAADGGKVVGGGFFAHATRLLVSVAWDNFGEANGARSLAEMRSRIARYRRVPPQPGEDYTIGCILLQQPFFLPRELWVEPPPDWHPNIVQGRSYDLSAEPGRSLWSGVQEALRAVGAVQDWPTPGRQPPEPRYGDPIAVRQRLGQGSFRIMVTDAYERRCAVTGERVLPVLEAAHIRPYAEGGEHRVDNGLLLRSDLHKLFDKGYLTVTPALHLEVSRRIRDDFDNGRQYYSLHGHTVRPPLSLSDQPSAEFLSWHNERVYRG